MKSVRKSVLCVNKNASEEPSGIMDVFTPLIVVKVSQVCKMDQVVHFDICAAYSVIYTSIRLLKKKRSHIF